VSSGKLEIFIDTRTSEKAMFTPVAN